MIVFVYADVAVSDKEDKGRRHRCDPNVRFLEPP